MKRALCAFALSLLIVVTVLPLSWPRFFLVIVGLTALQHMAAREKL